jgi:Transposase DDE domain
VRAENLTPRPLPEAIVSGSSTPGGESGRQLRAELLRPSKVYVVDRGYESYELLADIRGAGSSFVDRLQAGAAARTREPARLFLVTDRLDRPAELVGLAYRYRWGVELFFRWLKGTPSNPRAGHYCFGEGAGGGVRFCARAIRIVDHTRFD